MPPAPPMQREAVGGAVIPVLSVRTTLASLTVWAVAALALLRLLVLLDEYTREPQRLH